MRLKSIRMRSEATMDERAWATPGSARPFGVASRIRGHKRVYAGMWVGIRFIGVLVLIASLLVGIASVTAAQPQSTSVFWDTTTQVNSNGKGSHIELEMPDNIGEGDLILAIVNAHYLNNPQISIIPPGEFQPVASPIMDGDGSSAVMGAFWKIAEANEPPHYVFELNREANAWEAVAVRIVGAHRTEPIGAYEERILPHNAIDPAASGNAQSVISTPSVNTVDNSLLVAAMTVGAINDNGGTDLRLTPPFFSPDGMTEVWNNSDETGWTYREPGGQHNRLPALAIAVEDRPSGGNTGRRVFKVDQLRNRRLAFAFNIHPHYAMGFHSITAELDGEGTKEQPYRLPINGASIVSAIVVDVLPDGQSVSGARVTFESSDPEQLRIIGSDEVLTDGLGRAQILVGNVDREPGDVTITARMSKEDPNIEDDDEITAHFRIGGEGLPDPPAASHSNIIADPLGDVPPLHEILYADGVDASTITVTARDGQHNRVPNTLVSLAITDGHGTLTETWGVTGADGAFTADLTSFADGVVDVTAYVGLEQMSDRLIGTETVKFSAKHPPTLTDVSPDEGARDSVQFVTLTGTNFLVDSVVDVSGSGITAVDVVVHSPTEMTAYFIIDGTAELGARDVAVRTVRGMTSSRTFTVDEDASTFPPEPDPGPGYMCTSVVSPCIFTVPENVFEIIVEGWGGGGGGGGITARAWGGARTARGGGGGGYARTVMDVFPGQQFKVIAGAGGAGGATGNNPGEDGYESTFSGPLAGEPTDHLKATGGKGGDSSSTDPGGAGGAGTIGDVKYSGGAGSAGGGGGAGTGGDGGDARDNDGGAGGYTDGGAGADAPTSASTNGRQGAPHGGGGSGGRGGGLFGGSAGGGDGADGRVIVSWETAQYGLQRVSGNNQRKPVTEALEPFVVQAIDHTGGGVAGQTVSFRVAAFPTGASEPQLAEVEVITDSEGLAETTLTLGEGAGQYAMLATLLDRNGDESSEPVGFVATATAGQPAHMRVDVTKDQAVADGDDEVEFTVTVADEYDNPVPDVMVAVTDAGDLSALVDVQQPTDESGAIVFASTSTVAGLFTVEFGVEELDSQHASATFVVGPPARLAITGQPAEQAVSGTELGPQPVVQLQDAHGNMAKQEGVEITAALIIENPEEDGSYIAPSEDRATLLGTYTLFTDEHGAVEFEDLMITGDSGTYYLQFESDGLARVLSDPIELAADNHAPVAEFTWAPEFPRFGEQVRFTNESTDPDKGDVLTYKWDFGDGGTSTDEDPVHTYAQIGGYTVTLTVEDQGGLKHAIEKTLPVTADVRGYVFHDLHRTGERDPDANGLDRPELFVTLMEGEMVRASVPFDAHTGEYTFSRLPEGEYEVRVTYDGLTTPVVPDGWTLTRPGGDVPKVSLNVGNMLPTVASSTKAGPDFGFAQGYIIRGTVFRDDGGTEGMPNDGQRNGDEAGVGGLRLRAVHATNGSPLGSAMTDATGAYEFVSVGGEFTEPPTIRLVLTGTNWRATGYTPGDGNTPVQYSEFHELADVLLQSTIGAGHLYDGVDFGVVPPLSVSASATGSAAPGAFVVYPIRFQMGTKGSIDFNVSTPRGWQYVFYHDRNGNGAFDPDDALVNASDVVGPGDTAFLMIVHVPTWASAGQADGAQVTASFTYDGNGDLKETQQFYAVTTVSYGRLELTASVRNVANGGGFEPTLVAAKPGDTIEYLIEYANVDGRTATGVRLFGTVPMETSLDHDAYGPGNPVRWTTHEAGSVEFYPKVEAAAGGFSFEIPDVLPGQAGSFTYKVTID